MVPVPLRSRNHGSPSGCGGRAGVRREGGTTSGWRRRRRPSHTRAVERPWFPPGFDTTAHHRARGAHADAILTALADRQHGVVTARQARELGVSGPQLRDRLRSRHLHRVSAGVYLVGHVTCTPAGRHMAGVLGAGRGALLAGLSAAAQGGAWRHVPPEVHVIVPHGRSVARGGIRAREAFVADHERTLADGIPCLTFPRVLLDVSAHHDRATLERVWHEAVYRRLVHLPAVALVLREHRAEPGTVELRRLLERRARAIGDVANRLEAEMREIITAAGMPEPHANVPLVIDGVRLRPDLYIPERGLVFETDGREGHDDPERVQEDERRDALYRRAGLSQYRFGWWAVHYERPRVLADMERYEAAWRLVEGRWTPEVPQPRFALARPRSAPALARPETRPETRSSRTW